DPLAYQLGKQASARWKIRELVGELLLMPKKFGQQRKDQTNKLYQPSQIILYPIPEKDISSTKELLRDGDYVLPYSSQGPNHTLSQSLDAENDPKFQRENLIDGAVIGLLDWHYERGGYGNELPGSMETFHQRFKGEYNRGVWTDKSERPSDEYRHHVHIGF
ncbi:hypothetical protein HY523_00895, partial [Candidatus Berkelbacteria bacterium]|nr:hypothetical protein [Candidatus Berkelbacteria bacterium]